MLSMCIHCEQSFILRRIIIIIFSNAGAKIDWNGLLHTFEGETCSEDDFGDYVADTPQQRISTSEYLSPPSPLYLLLYCFRIYPLPAKLMIIYI